jgi:hypothetical protein
VLPYGLLYGPGFAPWERRDVAEAWRPLLDGAHAPPPGRALDVGFDLLYDFGCIHGLSDAARKGAAGGLTQLVASGVTLLLTTFKALLRRANPTLYRLSRRTQAGPSDKPTAATS